MYFLISKASLAFTWLKKAFTKAPILYHFDPKRHIQIETDASNYAIEGVLSQLTTEKDLTGQVIHETNDLNLPFEIGQWHLVIFFSQKLILTEIYYKTYNQELLAIVEAFKTWHYYLKGFKYEVFVLTDHNNLYQFMDTKNLSSCQVR